MASGNRKKHSCGHFNYGVGCHRCAQGEALKKLAAAEKDAAKKPKMLDEAMRLLGPSKTKAQRRNSSTPNQVTYDQQESST